MKKLVQSLFVLLLIATSVLAQDRRVTGKVIAAEDGLPLPGVSVKVVGTNQGTQTDAKGNFSISVPANAKNLEISYIGFASQILPIGTQSVFNVKLLNDNKQLSEVVVTALGISRDKKALGYSTQNVSGEEISKAANTGLAGALQGKVSGVEIVPSSGMPGASAKITIRGSRSFTGDNTPLYVIDGLPISSASDFDTGNSVTGSDYATRGLDIDPNDIESINILKGQAASALYGIRASNGVIIITTKRGKNAKGGKPEISFSTNTAFDVISIMPDLQKEYAQGSYGAYVNNTSFSWGPIISELPNDPTYGGNVSNAKTQNGAALKPGMYYVPQRATAGLDPWATPQVYDNQNNFFNTGKTYSNSLNIVQGSDKGFYGITLGSTNSTGIIPSTKLNRYNAKFAGEAKLSKNWTTGFTGNVINSKLNKQSSANNSVIATVYPAPPSYDLAGIPSFAAGQPTKQNTYRSTSGFDGAYWAVNNNVFSEETQRFYGNAFAQYTNDLGTTNQKLAVKYQLGGDSYTTNYIDLYGYGHANLKGEISNNDYTQNEFNSLLTATYTWKINSDLNFDALVGNEFIDQKTTNNYSFGKDFNFPGFNSINNASSFSSNSDVNKKRTIGNFGSLSLDYKSMLYLNITGRNDLVSTLPRGSRSFFYPSASLSWIFTELEPLRNNILTYGKIRTSYAEVGQSGRYKASYFSTPVFGGGFSSGTPILYPIGSGIVAYTQDATVYDPNLHPQNTKSYEIGTDLAFYNGLINLSYTFSRQNVNDQIFEVPLPGSTGSSSLMTNGGSIHTNSHELTLGFSPIRKKDIRWDFAFNFSKIDNYVDALAPGVNSIFLGGFSEPQVRASIGEKFPTIYGVSYLRNDEGKIIVDSNGFPEAGDERVIGNISPKFLLGFNTSFEYKKFKVGAVLDWKNGGQMYSGTAGLLDFYGASQYSADVRKPGTKFMFPEDAVKVTGTDGAGNPIYAKNDIQIDGADAQDYFSSLNNISESMIYNNSFVKLREVTLGYPVVQKNGVTLNLTAFARNILVWSQIKGIDPETSQGNNNISGAFERLSLPGTSSYGLGLNVKF